MFHLFIYFLGKKNTLIANTKALQSTVKKTTTNRLCQKLNPVLPDSLSQSSDVTKGANGELAKLSRSLRQKGK